MFLAVLLLPPHAGEGWDGGERRPIKNLAQMQTLRCPHPNPPPHAVEGEKPGMVHIRTPIFFNTRMDHSTSPPRQAVPTSCTACVT